MKFKLFITMRTTTSTLFLPKIFWFMREWWDLNYKCFSISFDDEDIYGDNGNAFDDDGDNDNEDAFFDTIFVIFKIVNLIAGIQSNHKLCINSKIFLFFRLLLIGTSWRSDWSTWVETSVWKLFLVGRLKWKENV